MGFLFDRKTNSVFRLSGSIESKGGFSLAVAFIYSVREVIIF